MASREEMLLTLLSMGFDYEKCEFVLDCGVTNVEDAIQQLINPIPIFNPPDAQKQNKSSQSSSGQFSSSQSPSTQGEPSKVKSRFERQRKEQADFERKEAKNVELLKKRQKLEDRKVKQNLLKEIEDDRKHYKKNEESTEKPTESGSKEDKIKDKEEFEKRERELAWKKIQIEKRKDRQQVLHELNQDKLNRKEKFGLKGEKDKVQDNQQPIQPSPVKTSATNSSCRIQVVFPSGSNQCFTLPVDAKLLELFNLCVQNPDIVKDNYFFLQTFPKTMFTMTESENSLQDLGLWPSAKLLLKEVRCLSTEAATESGTSNPTDAAEKSEEMVEISENLEDVDMQMQEDSENQPIVPNPVEVETEQPAIEVDNVESQHQDRRLHSRLLQGEFVNIIHDIDNVDLENEDLENPIDRPQHNERAQLFQEAIEKRLIGNNDDFQDLSRKRKMFSLQTVVAKFIATQMLKKEPRVVDFMWKLNPQAANVLVKTLRSTDKLSVDALNLLKPCKLQEINLDLCRLTSLDVILALKSHHYLRRISLKSVTCITDRAVETILKNSSHVTYLNLSQCDALVGTFLVSKLGLSKLKTIILDQAKIKNEYIKSFLRIQPAKALAQLSLNYCSITNEAFELVEEYHSLKILSVNHTMITSLSFLSYFPNLIGLGLKSLNVENKEMSYVGGLKHLTWLDLQGTNISYDGLQHIKDKRLAHFSLPDRLCVDNKCLTVIEGFQLTSLDLSDYIHLDDGCMKSISMIQTLCTLSMSNTKITDSGASEIRKLTKLEALDISRTNVTSKISPLFQDLIYLETLNIARTNITNEFLTDLNYCALLSKLSLSNTQIDDEGIRVLRLPKLSTIIADATGVTIHGVRILEKNCPLLRLVRNSNQGVNYTRDVVH